MTPAERLLAQIGAQVRIAEESLADEHEGNVRHAVALIALDASRLIELVESW